jgi:hypothetical protein
MVKRRAGQSSPGPGSISVAQQTHTQREREYFGIPPSVLTRPWLLQYCFALGIETRPSLEANKQASKFYIS